MPDYPTTYPIRVHPRVSDALNAGGPVVALESTIVSHGLPRPDNLTVAREIEQVVREHGAEPATIGMIGGQIWIGLDDDQLATARHRRRRGEALRTGPAGGRGGRRARRDDGGQHQRDRGRGRYPGVRDRRPRWRAPGCEQTFDESADLVTLARTRIAVVCAGVKSILDVPATLERLETLGVTVLGYQTTRFPGFFIADSGYDLDWSVDSPGADRRDAARAARAGRRRQPA